MKIKNVGGGLPPMSMGIYTTSSEYGIYGN
ncbi:hypothetical protein SAMN04490193_4622 [Pseudomonas marginalis]|nr:hypothetical protein [Pseudomonas sp. 8 R 14]SAM33574.1 hypothetical protein BN1864_LIB5394:03621 [Pseudomonas sp. 1 R 17]SED10838.1 hypothetical protein SAMN04490193_4622 [Pseudomonas marginalis]